MSNIIPYWFPCSTGDHGAAEAAAEEYAMFRRCLPQLTDADSMTGDLTGKWVIFRNGWLADFQGYKTEREAINFSRAIFRDEPSSWIVVQVDVTKHQISALHLLADALADVEFNDVS